MGRELQELKVVFSVSRHNSDQDAVDDSLAEELQNRIEMIAYEHRYESIAPMVF